MKRLPELASLGGAAAGPVATSEALLDAAERLFAQKGVEGVSVREIVRAAGVNLAAINYHFGSKERLALEVFARRLRPVNRDRLARLEALEKAAGPRELQLEQIIEALIRPALEAEDEGTLNCMRLVSRCFQEPNPEVKKFVEQEFAEVVPRFDAAILRAKPDLPPGELFWRLNFLFGALHHGQEMWLRFDHIPRPAGRVATKVDREGLIQRIIAFAAAGISASLPASAFSRALPITAP